MNVICKSMIYGVFLLGTSLCIFGVKRREQGKISNSLLTRNDSDFIKGIATVGVFLAHIFYFIQSNGRDDYAILTPFSYMGGLGVLLFLFSGGYGIYKSLSSSYYSAGKFWLKRFLKVYIPSVIINEIFVIVEGSLQGHITLKTFVVGGLLGAWYIDVIMLEYAAAFLGYVLARKNIKKLIWILIMMNTFIFIAFYFGGLDDRWRNGLFVFVFGVFIACYEDNIKELCTKFGVFALCGSVGAFVLLGVIFTIYKGSILADITKNAAGCFLALLLICIFQKYKCGNKIIWGIGKRSLYVYLIHLGIRDVTYELMNRCDRPYYFWVLIWVVSSILLAEIAYRVIGGQRKVFNHE